MNEVKGQSDPHASRCLAQTGDEEWKLEEKRKIEFCHFMFYIALFPFLIPFLNSNEQINFEFLLSRAVLFLASHNQFDPILGGWKRTLESEIQKNGNRYEITFCVCFHLIDFRLLLLPLLAKNPLTFFRIMLYSCPGLNSCRCQMQPMSPYGASTSTWTAMSRARWRQNLRSQLPPPGVLCKLLVSAKYHSFFSPCLFQLARILLILCRRWCDEKRQEVAKEQSSDGKCFCFAAAWSAAIEKEREREKVTNIQRIIHRIFTHIQFSRIFYDPVGSWWQFFLFSLRRQFPQLAWWEISACESFQCLAYASVLGARKLFSFFCHHHDDDLKLWA